jgi:hypothetical protein
MMDGLSWLIAPDDSGDGSRGVCLSLLVRRFGCLFCCRLKLPWSWLVVLYLAWGISVDCGILGFIPEKRLLAPAVRERASKPTLMAYLASDQRMDGARWRRMAMRPTTSFPAAKGLDIGPLCHGLGRELDFSAVQFRGQCGSCSGFVDQCPKVHIHSVPVAPQWGSEKGEGHIPPARDPTSVFLPFGRSFRALRGPSSLPSRISG